MSSFDRTCEWVLEHIDLLVDDAEPDLSDHDRLAVARHVESCAACASELALARRLRASLREMAVPAAPMSAIERAERELAAQPGKVVALRPRVGARRWWSVAAAALVLVSGVWIERDRRHARELAVEEAAREAGVAFAYFNKYARRTGDIVQDEVIEQRLVAPVERAMEKSGMGETKSESGQS